MITEEQFAKEFEHYTFQEIHRDPAEALRSAAALGAFPKSLRPGWFGGIIAGSYTLGTALPPRLPRNTKNLDEELEKELKKREPNFYDYLVAYMDEKHIENDADLYRKAEVGRASFSKIRSMRETGYRPSKPTVIKLCLALNLTAAQTQEMLHTTGYGMSNASVTDKIIMFFIEHNEFDIFTIDDKIYDKTRQQYLIEKL